MEGVRARAQRPQQRSGKECLPHGLRPLSRALSSAAQGLLAEDVIMTKKCAERLKNLNEEDGSSSRCLRLSVESGGCSGFQYIFDFDDEAPREGDIVFSRDDATIVIDNVSIEFVKGSTIDFEESMIRSAFTVINNPNSEAGCGCGSSFAVKLD